MAQLFFYVWLFAICWNDNDHSLNVESQVAQSFVPSERI